jgi:transposase-like protein
MSGKSPLAASAEQRDGLRRLSISTSRAEADRARAILLSLSGWKSAAIGEIFGVREDTVRDWRSTFMRDGERAVRRAGSKSDQLDLAAPVGGNRATHRASHLAFTAVGCVA